MRRIPRGAVLVGLLVGLCAGVVLATPPAPPILRIRIDGVIAPSSARYLVRAIREAERIGARALLVELNTPGGLMKSMDEITGAMLNARVPILVYISPSGARAASAGVFITYAANIAAMAPATRIGAAHPVGVGPPGGEEDRTSMDKVVNDAVAGLRAIARRRGRNADWAEAAVRRSVSIDEEQAVKLRVVDLVAPNTEALLAAVHGRTVETAAGTVALATRGADVRTVHMDLRERFLDLLSDPNIGLILMTIAIYGIIFELSNPGAILPGVVGAIALVLALASFAILQVNAAGLLLIALSVVFFIADIKVPGHGVLTVGGILAFLFGALLLTERQAPFLRVSFQLAAFIAVLTGAFFLFAVGAGIRAQRARARMGSETLIGAEGVARTEVGREGLVYVAGEMWTATAEAEPIPEGSRVVVVGVEGLRLRVRPAGR
ncbi:MAG: nodulation protein NfeD [Armatimonadota bacterium]|nr:nodulation protein NfeD [Armatimonadota bacterium]MDR7452597.1 nodulation protein NfeD [Armatimonadota bacterium]MDR7468242.1 nodulation protein NfeD [Armatimonadota bacterium]MDR7495236.1 nodulation protein NfeD [Armatimonadota bacterium]MDR7500483.1 nodulation protein NfeD [Armatimonadota bacterium]